MPTLSSLVAAEVAVMTNNGDWYLGFATILDVYIGKGAPFTNMDQLQYWHAQVITSTPYAMLPLFATGFAACTGGIWFTFIEPYLI